MVAGELATRISDYKWQTGFAFVPNTLIVFPNGQLVDKDQTNGYIITGGDTFEFKTYRKPETDVLVCYVKA